MATFLYDPDGGYYVTPKGSVAAGATDSGNPVKVGGVYNSTLPTLTNGQRGDLQLGVRGAVNMQLYNPDTASAITGVADNADAIAVVANPNNLRVANRGYLFNGTTWDRRRNNNDLTILASAARTASVDSADFTNYNGRGLHVVIDVTAIAATPSVVFTIQGKDILSGKYYTILASAAVTAVSTTILRVHPGLTAAANVTANDLLPRTWRISAVNGDADSITYSIGASVIV